jgi:hypothetical protein
MYRIILIIIFAAIVGFCYYNRHLFDFDDDTFGPDNGDFYDD